MTKAAPKPKTDPVDGDNVDKTEPEYPAYPDKIKLTHIHGFIDDDNRKRSWNAGDVITDEDEIMLLVDRKAHYIVLED